MPLLLIAAGVLLLLACKKKIYPGTVILNVKHNGQLLPDAQVFMKGGTYFNPNIPLSAYDQVQTTDALGHVTFDKLVPQEYFFFVAASVGSSTISGSIGTVVNESDDRQNRTELVVIVQ